MGLKRGVHFSVKMPEGGKAGYVSILKEGLAYAARLSVRGKDEQQRELAGGSSSSYSSGRRRRAGARNRAPSTKKPRRSWRRARRCAP
jgi:hypothetical protein